jgi:regulator of sigma E protease
MSGLLIELLAFVVAIGVLVSVHEYGHYWVARRLGFKVLRYSIGFGRPLLKRTGRDGIEYVLAAIPLGGYVKLADEREGPVDPADLARAFNRRPVWARLAVLAAGAGANFVFAALALWVVYMNGVPGLRPVVGEVRSGSLAASAGLAPADEITAVGDTPVATREAVVLALLSRVVDDGHVQLRVRRGASEAELALVVPDARRRALTEPGAFSEGLGFQFTQPHVPAVIGKVIAGGPAAVAGLAAGDLVLAVDGHPIGDFAAFQAQVSARPGTRVVLGVRRGKAELEIPVQVGSERDTVAPGHPLVGRIRVMAARVPAFPPEMLTIERYGPLGAVRPALAETWSKTALTVKFLWRMITGDVSLKNVSGPISIATYAGVSALEGTTAFLSFLALISISLGVLNLLPIPILDGGQIVYQLAEALQGRPLSTRVQVLGQQLGIVLLMLLMSLAFYNDIARHFG